MTSNGTIAGNGPHTEDHGARATSHSDLHDVRRFGGAVWCHDLRGRTLWAGPGLPALLGRDDASGPPSTLAEVLAPGDRADLEDTLASLRDGGDLPGSSTWTACSTTGAALPLRSTDRVDRDEHGHPVSVTRLLLPGAVEAELVRSLADETFFREHTERLTGIGSWWLDVTDGSLGWSSQLAEICGLAGVTEVDVATVLSRFHPEDLESVAGILASTSVPEGPFEVRARFEVDGGYRWLVGRGETLHDDDGRPVRVLGTVEDVHQHVIDTEAAAARERTNTLLRDLAELTSTSSDVDELLASLVRLGVADKDRWTGCHTFVVGPDGRLEAGHAFASPAAPEEWDSTRVAAAEECRRRGVQGWSLDDRRFVFPVAAHGVVAVVLVMENPLASVSRPQAERVAEQADLLVGRVVERHRAADALRVARDEAVRASAAKSDFLAAVSHEVRTPLNGVLGLNELLLGTSLTARQRELAQASYDAGQRLLGLLNDVLDLSKVEAGRLALRRSDLDVRDLCDDVVTVFAGTAARAGTDLVVCIDPDVPDRLHGDGDRIAQVLTNLVSNALQHAGARTVVVAAAAEAEGRRTRVRFSVSDDGRGIHPDELPRLFEPFHTGGESRTRGGTGLGLAISHRLTRAHRGSISVESALGEGSTFRVDVLLEPPHGPRSDPGDDAARSRLSGRRALLVTADDAVARGVAATLGRWGVRAELVDPVTAPTVMREAIREDHPVEVVVWDLPHGSRSGQRDRDELFGPLPAGGFVAWCTGSGSDPRHLPGAGEAMVVERPLTRRSLRAALLRSDGVLDPATVGGAGLDPVDVGVAPGPWGPPPSAPAGRDVPPTSALPDVPLRPGAAGDRVRRAEPSDATDAATDAATDPAEVSDERPPVRVLVVEDNPVNHLVARGMLEAIGCQVDVAEDGAQALAAYDPALHDLVLMDLQMPVMDGFEATAALRELQARGSRRVPVVAFTAAALDSERAEALAAGMDDFVTKPVSTATLRTVVSRWVPEGAVRAQETTPPAVDAAQPVDLARIGELTSLPRGSGRHVEAAVASLRSALPELLAEISGAAAAADMAGLRTSSRVLVGAAGSLGLARLAAAGRRLESAATALATGNVHPDSDGTAPDPRALDRLAEDVLAAARVDLPALLERATEG